jgi:hypothetical protein
MRISGADGVDRALEACRRMAGGLFFIKKHP